MSSIWLVCMDKLARLLYYCVIQEAVLDSMSRLPLIPAA
jgi:hypothetical protein